MKAQDLNEKIIIQYVSLINHLKKPITM